MYKGKGKTASVEYINNEDSGKILEKLIDVQSIMMHIQIYQKVHQLKNLKYSMKNRLVNANVQNF